MCPVCSSTSHLMVCYRPDGGRVVRCTQCSLLRIDPFPDATTAESLHGDDYFDRGLYGGQYCQTHGGHSPPDIWQEILVRIKSYRAGGDLLDVGCAHGFFLRAAVTEGFKGHGVELVREAAEHGRTM